MRGGESMCSLHFNIYFFVKISVVGLFKAGSDVCLNV